MNTRTSSQLREQTLLCMSRMFGRMSIAHVRMFVMFVSLSLSTCRHDSVLVLVY